MFWDFSCYKHTEVWATIFMNQYYIWTSVTHIFVTTCRYKFEISPCRTSSIISKSARISHQQPPNLHAKDHHWRREVGLRLWPRDWKVVFTMKEVCKTEEAVSFRHSQDGAPWILPAGSDYQLRVLLHCSETSERGHLVQMTWTMAQWQLDAPCTFLH